MSYNPNQPTDNTPLGQPSSQHGAAAPQQPYGSTGATAGPAPQYAGTSNPFGAPQQPIAPNFGANAPHPAPGAYVPLAPKKTGSIPKTAKYPAILAAVAGLIWIIVYFAMYKKNFNAGDISATKSAITLLTITETLFYLGLIGAVVLALMPKFAKRKNTPFQPQPTVGYGQAAPYGAQQSYGQPAPQQPYGQPAPQQPYGQSAHYGAAAQQPPQAQYPHAVAPSTAPSTAKATAPQYSETAPVAATNPSAAQPSSQHDQATSISTPCTPEMVATTAQYDASALTDAVDESSTAPTTEKPSPNPQTPWGQTPQGTNPWAQQQPPSKD